MPDELTINHPDGTTRIIAAIGPETTSPAASSYAPTSTAQLPATVDLRPLMANVRDRDPVASPAASIVASAYEYLLRRQLGQAAYPVSHLALYFGARKVDGTSESAAKTSVASAIESLLRHGACSQALWSDDSNAIADEPSSEALSQGEAHSVEGVERVARNTESFRQALAAGYPIVLTTTVFPSVERQRAPGLIASPSARERKKGPKAQIPLLCVGYSDRDERFIVQNCWGRNWGDEGYAYLPYRDLMDAELTPGDGWILRAREALQQPEDCYNLPGQLLPESGPAFEQFKDEDWGHLLDALGDLAIETRVALLYLRAVDADKSIAEDEVLALASRLETIFNHFGSRYDADKVLQEAASLLDDRALVDDTITMLEEHLAVETLELIVRSVSEAAAADDDAVNADGVLSDMIDEWLGGASPRAEGMVDGLVGEYQNTDFQDGVYGDDDPAEDGFGGGYDD